MGNTPSLIDLDIPPNTFLASAFGDSDFAAALVAPKVDEVGQETDVSELVDRFGRRLADLYDDLHRAFYQPLHLAKKMWRAADDAGRDALSQVNGLLVGDILFKADTEDLWVCTVSNPTDSTWRLAQPEDVRVGGGTGSPSVLLSKVGTGFSDLGFASGGTARWNLRHETDSANGDLSIIRRDSGGSIVDRPIRVGLADGSVQLGNIIRANETGITANVVQTQFFATPLTADNNEVTTVATEGDAVRLRTPAGGGEQWVLNSGANRLQVFPSDSVAINGLATNASVSLAPGQSATFVFLSSTRVRTKEVLDLELIRTDTSLAYGSTNTLVMRWSSSARSIGSGITQNISATLGDSFQAPTGVYSISVTAEMSNAATVVLCSNGTLNNTLVNGEKAVSELGAAGVHNLSWTGRILTGEFIYVTSNGTRAGNQDTNIFTIMRVG